LKDALRGEREQKEGNYKESKGKSKIVGESQSDYETSQMTENKRYGKGRRWMQGGQRLELFTKVYSQPPWPMTAPGVAYG